MKLLVSASYAIELFFSLYLYQWKIINAAEPIDIVTEKTNLQKLIPRYPVMWLMIPDKETLISRREGPTIVQVYETPKLQKLLSMPQNQSKQDPLSGSPDQRPLKSPQSNPKWKPKLKHLRRQQNQKSKGLTKWQEKMIARRQKYEERDAPPKEGRAIEDGDVVQNWKDEDYEISEHEFLRQLQHKPYKWKYDKKYNIFYTDPYIARDYSFPWSFRNTRFKSISIQHGTEIGLGQITGILREILTGDKPPMKEEYVRDYYYDWPPPKYYQYG